MPLTLLCHVCNHILECERNNYGGQSCDACRAFFRRMVVKQFIYLCQENGICPPLCLMPMAQHAASCRLAKCLRSVKKKAMTNISSKVLTGQDS